MVNYTPMMTNDVQLIMDQIQLLQEVKILVEKVCKATVKTMAELTASKATNVDLVEALKQKEKRKN